MKNIRENIILADCPVSSIVDIKKALEEISMEDWKIVTAISNFGRTSLLKKIKRYLIYFFLPFKIFLHRRKYKNIVGWQQFYAIIFCFYCKIFHVKKNFNVYILNYTYKRKNGLIGKIYHKFMNSIMNSIYVDLIFLPSEQNIEKNSKDLNISKDKFRTLPFGIQDIYDKYPKESKNYILSIGRSNRDFDWLISQYKDIDIPLYIISDTYKTNIKLPENIKIINDVSPTEQFPYIMSCKMMIIPIKEAEICSGDTVLLTGMSFEKNIIVTYPSTLAEMYIRDNENGFLIKKEDGELSRMIRKIINEKIDIGPTARKIFIENYSRYKMGINMANIIKEYNETK